MVTLSDPVGAQICRAKSAGFEERLCALVAEPRGAVEPRLRGGDVLLDANSLEVAFADERLRRGVAVLRGLERKGKAALQVLLDAYAVDLAGTAPKKPLFFSAFAGPVPACSDQWQTTAHD